MAAVPPLERDAFERDLRIAREAQLSHIVPETRRSRNKTFEIWEAFCRRLGQDDPYFQQPGNDERRTNFLQVFAIRIRNGELSKSHKPVRSKQVEEALRGVGQGFQSMGLKDPRLTPNDLRVIHELKHIYVTMEKEDPAPTRVWPVTLRILQAALDLPPGDGEDQAQVDAINDLIIIAFYFLCRPGEYALAASKEGRSCPFRMQDLRFMALDRHDHAVKRIVSPVTAPLNDVISPSLVGMSLEFTDQKNAVRGETVGHGASGDPILCPLRASQRRVQHLREHGFPADTPLYTYRSSTGTDCAVTTGEITNRLRRAATTVQHITGIPADKITSYSLRSGGATALLCAEVDTRTIQLVGRWRSDAMIRYLRVMAIGITNNLAKQMLAYGGYTFDPMDNQDEDVPDLLPEETPQNVTDLLNGNYSNIVAAATAAEAGPGLGH